MAHQWVKELTPVPVQKNGIINFTYTGYADYAGVSYWVQNGQLS